MHRSPYFRTLLWPLLCLLFVCLLIACTRSNQKYSQEDVVQSLHSQIATAYADFEKATDALREDIKKHCAGDQDVTSERALQDHWIRANAAWQQVQVINFGPIAEQNRGYSIAFYPNSRANLEKRIETLLQSGNPLTTQNLETGSVSLRGLPALEYLLFANRPQAASTNVSTERDCHYLSVVATLLNEDASYLATQWQTGGEYARKIGDGISYSDFLESLLNGINERLSVIISVKLEKTLNGSTDALESPYSGQSLVNIKNNAAFIQALYGNLEENGLLRHLNDHGHSDIAKEMSVRLDLLQVNLAQVGPDIVAAQSSVEDTQKLQTVIQLFKSVQEYHARKVADALGVYIGFNSADGD